MKKILHTISLITFNVFAVLFGLAMLFSSLCTDPQIEDNLSQHLFGTGKSVTTVTGKEPVYYKTWYQSIEDLMAGNAEYAASAEAEGAVLLKNDVIDGSKKALPLNKATDKVSLFGVTAYNPMYSLDGAGEVKVNEDRKQSFKGEMEKVGLTVNNDLASWYNAHPEFNRSFTSANGVNLNINGTSWDDINTAAKTKEGYKTAIYVTGRMGNEGIDLPPYSTGSGTLGLTDGDYLKLTATEKALLTGLKAEKDKGTFDRIIVLINSASPILDDFIDNDEYGIDAALWIGFPGTAGLSAVAQILVGTVTPSGRLSTAWYADRKSYPSWNNFGNFNNGYTYVLYQEGVYVGYRYAETRYEDYVMGTAKAGDYDYDANMNYTFGYGLSYTDFSYEFVSLTQDTAPLKDLDYKGVPKAASDKRAAGDDLIAKVKVTNTGNTAGKEVVQIYLQQPYTAANIANGVEKPAAELVAFGKTSKLEPGAHEELTIKIDANKYFAAYDKVADTYVLDQGTYYLTAAKDAHNAVNNILEAKGASNPAKMSGDGDASLVKTVAVDTARSSAYKYWTLGGATVTNLFDHADPNTLDPNANEVKFMSRADWEGTVFETHQTVNRSTLRDFGRKFDGGGDWANSAANYPYYGNEYPAYGKTFLDKNGNEKRINLADMIGVEYEQSRGATAEDIALWDAFLDQLTFEETANLVGKGLRHTENIDSISKPYTNDINASNGLNWQFDMRLSSGGAAANNTTGFSYRFDSSKRDLYPTGYPCEGIIAASFNEDIAYVVGQAIGEDGLWAGASGLYGFGLNLHRNPYHGRVGEYYSEDSYLTGVMAGWASKGAQSKGLYVYNKHFVLNDQEVNRVSYSTFITEQALRQAHLRPFEIAIEIGDAMNVMTSFSRIGNYWSGNDYNLMTRCLRGEFGMRGFAVTDWYPSGGMNMTNGMLAGNDLPDGDGSGSLKSKGPGTGNGHLGQAMRVSAQRILYTVANSNAMNFFGEGTMVKTYDPEWFAVRDNIITATTVLFSVSAVFVAATSGWLIVSYILGKKKAA